MGLGVTEGSEGWGSWGFKNLRESLDILVQTSLTEYEYLEMENH